MNNRSTKDQLLELSDLYLRFLGAFCCGTALFVGFALASQDQYRLEIKKGIGKIFQKSAKPTSPSPVIPTPPSPNGP